MSLWRPDRFAKVNDVMLAESLRQLLPVAELGVRKLKSFNAAGAFRRAEVVLQMWARQERGRLKRLDGPLPVSPGFEYKFREDPKNQDPGQKIPPECSRRRKAGRK